MDKYSRALVKKALDVLQQFANWLIGKHKEEKLFAFLLGTFFGMTMIMLDLMICLKVIGTIG